MKALKFYLSILTASTLFVGCQESAPEAQTAKFDKNIEVAIAVDSTVSEAGEVLYHKALNVKNVKTGATLSANINSAVWEVFFYMDSNSKGLVLRIADKSLGQNLYDYNTLVQLVNHKNCFEEEGGCGGFDDARFEELGAPTLIFSRKGYEMPMQTP